MITESVKFFSVEHIVIITGKYAIASTHAFHLRCYINYSFFKGIRISAGKRGYQEAIKKAREDYKAAVAANPEKKVQLKAGSQ